MKGCVGGSLATVMGSTTDLAGEGYTRQQRAQLGLRSWEYPYPQVMLQVA
jgi:hypothetical protein